MHMVNYPDFTMEEKIDTKEFNCYVWMLKTKKMFFRVPTQCFSNTNEGTLVIFPIVNEDSIEELGAQCGLSQQFLLVYMMLY